MTEREGPRSEARDGSSGSSDDFRWEHDVNAALSEICEPLILPGTSIARIAHTVLEQARRLTASEHGFVSSIDPRTGDCISHTLTAMLPERCQVTPEKRIYIFQRRPDGRYPGLWGHALNTRKSFYTNSPAEHPASEGLPEGHIPILRLLTVPVLLKGEPAGQITLANAPRDYTELDLAAITRLSEFYALAILRVRTEDSLSESERKYREVVESLNEGIWVIDENGRTTFANSCMARMLGLGVEELQGRHIHDFMDARGIEICARNMERRRQGIHENHEFELLRKDGTRIETMMVASPLYDASGEYAGSMAAVLDITERKGAQDALQRERNFTEVILSTLGALVVVLDRQGRIIRFNRACEVLTGYAFEEVQGKEFWNIFLVPEEVDGVRSVFSMLRAGQFPNQHENYWRTRDGSRRFIAWSNTAILAAGGEVEYIVGTGIDVTELREAERRLRTLNDTLERQVAERTAVAEHRAAQIQAMAVELTKAEQRERRRLAQVLHDHLQQLLVGAKFRVSVVRGRTRDAAVRTAVQDIDDLLGQAIEASRTLTFDLCPPILHEEGLPGGLRWLARSMAEKHGLHVDLEIPESAGTCDQVVAVFLFDAVRELLFNVVKHAKTRRALVALDTPGKDQVRVRVEDEGIGFVCGGSDGRGPVCGFGLFNVRERLRLLGGSMDVESAPGRGTRISLLAPCRSAGSGEGAERGASSGAGEGGTGPDSAAEAPRGERPRIRVLLVDDHEVMRRGLAALIAEEPDLLVVGESRDGRESVELARRLRPDVVIMDVGLPGMSGIEATRAMRSEVPEVRVIGLSMHSEADMAARMLGAGAETYLGKAGPSQAILDAIRRAGPSPR